MPQPAWFNTATFYEQKAIECNLIKYLDRTDWTPQSVAAYLESLGITPYENFLDNANRENVSPSQYFNVAEYLQAKADQLNALNDGAGYQNKTDWNQQSVLQAFDAANLSAWDHFTVAGQFENVNPSNSFDIGAFWAAKLASLNNDYVGGYEGRQWTMEQMQDVFRDLNINAIENVPDNPGGGTSLVSAVPADKQVSPGIFSPWGNVEPAELVEQKLETGPEVIAASPVPTKYVGTVTGSESRSTFNAQDQITGGNARDELAISMEADFRGMNRDGFVRDIDTVNLADAANRDLTFNAKGVEGVDTWNVDGNVNLASLDQTGITINYDGVDTKNGIEVGFAQNVTNATNDSLTIGLNEVFVPGRANSQYGTDQPDQQVDFTAHGIERITLNSTGKDQNMLNLVDTPYLEDVTITGDAALSLRAQNYCRVSNIDASEATGNLDIQHGSWPLQTAVLGSGNDVLETWQIRPDATVDGGDGNDSLIMADARGEYTLNMTNVATLGLMQTGNDVTIQGNNIDGMENLLLRNNWNGHDITIANFGQSELNVQAHQNNNLDLYVADITDMDIHVGDYNKNTIDNLTGTINLGAVTDLSITADDGINTDHQTYFTSVVNADKVQNLALSSSKESFVVVEDGSNLGSVANITASGYGDLFMGGGESLIGVNSGAVRVDASNMANGSFNGQFLGNRTQNASFAYTGSSLANNNVTVDSSYAKIAYTGGMGEDSLTLIADNTVYTKQNLTADMRGGDDTLIVAGTLGEGCDFSGVMGLTRVEFVNMSPNEVAAANINWGDFTPTKSNVSYIGDVIVTPGQPVDLGTWSDAGSNPVDVFLAGGTPEITGRIDKPNGSINLDAAANENTPSGLNVNFGQDGLEIEAAQNLVAIGGALQNKLQGEISNVSDVVNIDNSAGQAADVVDLTISNADNVNVTGNGNSASQFDVSVSNVGDATVNTGASATATVDVSGVSGTADVTVGASTAGPVRVIGGSGADDALTFEGSGSFAPTTQGVENFTVTGAGALVNASNMQGVANLNVTGGNTVINGLSNTASDFVLTTNTQVALTNSNMDSVASLTVNNTATDGNVATVTGIPGPDTGGLPKTIGFSNVSSVKVTGSGNTDLNGQFGKNGATVNMVVEDNGSVDMGGAGLTGSNLSYTNNGASGVDKICANMTSSDAGSSYNFNLGGGNDELVLWTTQAGGGMAGSPAPVSVDLGAGADVLVLAGQDGSTGWVNSAGVHYWGGKFAITVNGFAQGDQLKVGTADDENVMVPGTFKDVSGYITFGALNTADLAPFFSALSNGATATVASGDNRVLLVGNDAYAVYTVKADGTDAINTVIQLTGVQGVSSFIGSDYLLS